MDTVAKPAGDDLDLDALMVRVREAAMAGGTSSAARPQTGGKVNDEVIDLVRVLDAQSDWNEHTRQSLVALVECLQTLRDDWLDANARVREEIRDLSALVAELRAVPAAPVSRSNRPAVKAKRPRAKGRSRRR